MQRQSIAVIGSGISGLGAAYILHPHHDITVYEKNAYIGGHSRTIEAQTPDGAIPVDTGFIVFNYRNYPLLTGLFNHLNVPVKKSDMSFGASIDHHWLEYGTQSIGNLFAQKRNLLRPQFLRMIADILRFNKASKAFLDKDPSVTLGECLDALRMGAWFRHYYLLAMGAAIWSTPLEQMLAFPARSFIRFFDNHGLLSVNDQPQWYTVDGGSREYVKRLTAPFRDRIKLECGASAITRTAQGIEVRDTQGGSATYDQVILACHSDQALHMLQNPTEAERNILGAIRYQPNEVVLHSDESFMPKHKGAWASWVYHSETRRDAKPAVSLSYWMNRLQTLPTKTNLIVTLNPSRPPAEHLVHNRTTLEHPVFDTAAIIAQEHIKDIQGTDRIWYCGAYQRYGFHEDGLLSAVTLTRAMGVEIPWK
ncbi:MAG: FAD-dependent oxidoreductase [Alphaproteobacteria bacterium]|nr:FAD-dependent oxidoreductase [Alphaproteobacteria bacterium]